MEEVGKEVNGKRGLCGMRDQSQGEIVYAGMDDAVNTWEVGGAKWWIEQA